MKHLTITERIDHNSVGLQVLRNATICDIINLEECEFMCSEAQDLIMNHPRTRVILSADLKEQIAYKLKGE